MHQWLQSPTGLLLPGSNLCAAHSVLGKFCAGENFTFYCTLKEIKFGRKALLYFSGCHLFSSFIAPKVILRFMKLDFKQFHIFTCLTTARKLLQWLLFLG